MRGLVMSGEGVPALTPDTARGLAADLAPHLRAMRALTAGTRYARADTFAGVDVSPATRIFVAGMLERMSAPGAAGGEQPGNAQAGTAGEPAEPGSGEAGEPDGC